VRAGQVRAHLWPRSARSTWSSLAAGGYGRTIGAMSHSAWTLIIVGVLIAAVGLECLAQCSDVARALIRRLTGD